MDQRQIQGFCAEVRTEVGAFLKEGLAAHKDRQDAMFAGLRGHNTAGMSFATGSFDVSTMRDRFHLNVPSSVVDQDAIQAIVETVTKACERHGLQLDVRKTVRGGSNFVLEGVLAPAPEPLPSIAP